MGVNKTSDAKLRANKKYQEKHKEEVKYNQYKSRARSFVRNLARKDDLLLLKKEIEDKLDKMS